MNDTCFKNCHGIDEDGHVMSAYDIATLSKALLNNYPDITKYTTIYMDSLRDGKSTLVNTNKLVRNYSGCTGLKTGSTSSALYNLSASASRDGMDLIAVVMKAPTSEKRFKIATTLLDYGFINFEYKKLISKDDIVKTIKLNKGIIPSINVIANKDLGVVLQKGMDIAMQQTISVPDVVNAPVSKQQLLGYVKFSLNDNILGECEVLSSENVNKVSIYSMNAYIFKKWFFILRK